jgi:general secretion pathway protein G
LAQKSGNIRKRILLLTLSSKANSNGFTFIEVMIVIMIIGILAAIALPNFLAHREKGKISRASLELKSIEIAIKALAIDTGLWPNKRATGDASGNEVWDLNAPSAGLVATDGGYPGWNGPYIANVSRDPWGNRYFFDNDYFISGQPFVAIGSFGPNGIGPNNYDTDNITIILSSS